MAHRAERLRRREAREAPFRMAEETRRVAEAYDIDEGFLLEAINCGGLASITISPRGNKNGLEVYGGRITWDGKSSFGGDGIVNHWNIPEIKGFLIKCIDEAPGVMIAEIDHSIGALSVIHGFYRGRSEVEGIEVTWDDTAAEEHVTMTKEGLEAFSTGKPMVDLVLEYVREQLFPE